MRLAADPSVVAARYTELATGATAVTGHVDARLRPIRWPDGTGEAELGAQVWSLTTDLAGRHAAR